MKKYYLIFTIFFSSLVFSQDFSAGMRTMGGSFSYFRDLDADVTMISVSPRVGYFITDNFMLELGFSHVSIDNSGDSEYYVDDEVHTRAFGGRLFANKFYVGFEFVQGFVSTIGTTLGNEVVDGLNKFDGNLERGLGKLGILSPLGDRLFLDSAIHYMFILDEDIREQASSNHDPMTQVAYITIGITYFWEPKK